MSKALRLSEKWFRFGLWIVAFVFASFLIGLGGTIVHNLPKVEHYYTLEDFIDKPAAETLRAELKAMQEQRQAAQDAHDQAEDDDCRRPDQRPPKDPGVPFRVPPGIKLIRIDPKTGMRAGPGTERAILEAFKPGTAPPDSYSVVGFGSGESDNGPGLFGRGVSPDADRAVRSGTGGLY